MTNLTSMLEELRESGNPKYDIIQTFRHIEETGDLPAGFEWDMLIWTRGKGWKGYMRGPSGATNWLKVKKIPEELLRHI